MQLRRRETEYAIGMPRGGPDLFEAEQLAIDERDGRHGVRDRSHAADGKAGARLHELGVGPPRRAHECSDLVLVHPPVARSNHEHCNIVGPAPEDHALGDLPDLDAQRIGRLLRSAGRHLQEHRCMRMPSGGQRLRHEEKALGPGSASFAHACSRCVLSRGTRCGSGSAMRVLPPSIILSSMRAAAWPSSYTGWCTVDSGGMA